MLFLASTLLLYVLLLLAEEINTIVDIKFVEFANQINKLEKENNDLKILNKTNNLLNRKTTIPVVYGCFN